MNVCNLCGKKEVRDRLDLGNQPICNRFINNLEKREEKYPLRIGQCEYCGIVQIISPVPTQVLRPIYDWITYTEPEGHIDQLANIIINLPDINEQSAICGISYKDESTLDLIKKRGFKNVWSIDPKVDLQIDDAKAGLETVLDRFQPEIVKNIAERHGKASVVVVRHSFEHASSPIKFMKAIKALIRDDGYIVMEVPDCQQAIEKFDYTTIWEEHTLYFTPVTFCQSFALGGFSLIHFKSFPYALENSLVGIGRLSSGINFACTEEIVEKERKRMQRYSDAFSIQSKKFKDFFADYRKNKGKIAILGAGHLTCMFINLLGIREFVDFVVDDSPNKQGLSMPGSKVSIYGSNRLIEEDIKLCLLGLAPDKEDKVIENNKSFLERGGSFRSIFPGSKRFLNTEIIN